MTQLTVCWDEISWFIPYEGNPWAIMDQLAALGLHRSALDIRY
jgi:hypothetical protein